MSDQATTPDEVQDSRVSALDDMPWDDATDGGGQDAVATDAGGDDAEAEADAAPEATAADKSQDAKDAAPEPDADPVVAKRLAQIQAREKEAKAILARERQEWEAERVQREQQWAPRIEAAERFEQMRDLARTDPAAALEMLGYGAQDWELAARSIYARSEAAAKDPRFREQVERDLRARRESSKVSTLEEKIERMERESREREQAQQTQRLVNEYTSEIAGTVSSEKTPLVSRWIAREPQMARNALLQVAQDMMANLLPGEVPTPAEVSAELERRKRAEFELFGFDPSVARVEKNEGNATETNTDNAAKTKPATAALGQKLKAPTTPRSEPRSRDELRREVLQDIPW